MLIKKYCGISPVFRGGNEAYFIAPAALSQIKLRLPRPQQGDIYTAVIPQVTLNEPCVCQVQISCARRRRGQPYTAKQTLYLYR